MDSRNIGAALLLAVGHISIFYILNKWGISHEGWDFMMKRPFVVFPAVFVLAFLYVYALGETSTYAAWAILLYIYFFDPEFWNHLSAYPLLLGGVPVIVHLAGNFWDKVRERLGMKGGST